ncbi:MAG: hypothetical protein AB8F74_23025 [Saprospiraceae bacterium]
MEEHFKNKLKNHKVDWNKEELLGNLKQELTTNKNIFDWKWLLLLPLLLLVTCWGWNSLQIQPISTTSTYTEKYTVLNKKENKSIQNIPADQNKTNTKNSLKLNKLETINEIKTELNPLGITLNQELKNRTSKTNINQTLSPHASVLTDSSRTNSPISKEHSLKDSFLLKTATTRQTEIPDNVHTTSELNSNLALNLNTIGKSDTYPISISSLKLQQFDLINEQKNLQSFINTGDKFPRISKVKTKNPFYVSVSGDIGYFYRNSIFNTNNEEFAKQLENNKKTENSLFAATTNIYIGYQHRSGFSLQFSIAYSEIKEVFNYKKTTTETFLDPKDEVLYFIIDNMDTSFVMDTSKTVRTTERTVKHFNKHTFYSIPLQVGYQFAWRKAKLIPRIGLSYTYRHNFKGRTNIIYENGRNEFLEENPELRFDLKNRIGIEAGLNLEYPLLKQCHVFAMATYRRSPKLTLGITEQRYHSLSLGAGFKFFLGKSN